MTVRAGRRSERLWYTLLAWALATVAVLAIVMGEWYYATIALVGSLGWVRAGAFAWRKTHPTIKDL